MSSVAAVTTPCTNKRHNTSPHGCRQSPNDVSRNSTANVQQNLFLLLSICWGRYAVSQLSITMIPEMLYGFHVWRTLWPRQYVDVNNVEIILNTSGCMRSCIGCKRVPLRKNGTTTGRNTAATDVQGQGHSTVRLLVGCPSAVAAVDVAITNRFCRWIVRM